MGTIIAYSDYSKDSNSSVNGLTLMKLMGYSAFIFIII